MTRSALLRIPVYTSDTSRYWLKSWKHGSKSVAVSPIEVTIEVLIFPPLMVVSCDAAGVRESE